MTFRPLFRLLAAATIAAAPWTHAAAYSGLYVFGDSLSDSGNNALALGVAPGQTITGNSYIPTQAYASGTYSNGAVWAQDLAADLGLSLAPSLAGGTNFAFGGAQTSAENPATGGFPYSLRTQTAQFLASSGSAPASGLYVVAGGGNNARAALTAITLGADAAQTINAAALSFANDIGSIVDQLQAAGAQSQNIVVWNTPNIGLTPAVRSAGAGASALAASIAAAMNSALQARLSFEAGVRTFDVFGLVSAASANPSAFGLANGSDACGAIAGCDPSTYLFWDGLHPTSAGHQLIAQSMLALAVPEPSSRALLLAGVLLVLLLPAASRRGGGAALRRIPGAPRATSTTG